MNLPNRLTMLRMLLIPVFLLCFFASGIPMHYLWALIVFAVASVTDALDGKIARKRGLVTDFGKLMDPLADKLLVISALVCLLQGDTFRLICLILVIARELLVTSIRLIAAGKGAVLAADGWGKLKTVSQMLWICLALAERHLYVPGFELSGTANPLLDTLHSLSQGLFLAMVALTAASGIHYCWKNRALFADA